MERKRYCKATARPLIGGKIKTTKMLANGNQIIAWSHNGGCHDSSTTAANPTIRPPINNMAGATGPSPTSLPESLRQQFGQASARVKYPENMLAKPQCGHWPLRPRQTISPVERSGCSSVIDISIRMLGRILNHPTSRCRRTGTARPHRRSASTRLPLQTRCGYRQ